MNSATKRKDLLFEAGVEMPSALRPILEDAATINDNYHPGRLAESIQRDILAALKDPGKSDRQLALLSMEITARIQQMRANSLWTKCAMNTPDDKSLRGATEEEFVRSSRTASKSFQEVWTDPADRIAVPAIETGALPHIIIAPKLISERFMRNVGLGEHLAKKRARPEERLAAKIAAIDHVRERILAALAPVPVSPRGNVKHTYRLFGLNEQSSRPGAILRTQEIYGEDRVAVLDLYSAERSVHHIDVSYKQELKLLAEIASKLDAIYRELAMNWDEVKRPENLIALLSELSGLVGDLEGDINKSKEKLREKIRNAARMVQQKNPGAARAAIDNVSRRLLIQYREEEIPEIFENLAADRKVIQSHIASERNTLEDLYEAVEKQNKDPRLADPEAPLVPEELAALLRRLEKMKAGSDAVHFLPNLPFGQKLSAYLGATIEALRKKPIDRQMASEYFMRAYVISKLARHYQFLMKLYETYSLYGKKGLDSHIWRVILNSSQAELNKISKGTRIYTREYNEIWRAVRAMESKLDEALKAYAEAPLSEKKPEIAAIKATISGVDIPELVGRLPIPNPDTIRTANAEAKAAAETRAAARRAKKQGPDA